MSSSTILPASLAARCGHVSKFYLVCNVFGRNCASSKLRKLLAFHIPPPPFLLAEKQRL